MNGNPIKTRLSGLLLWLCLFSLLIPLAAFAQEQEETIEIHLKRDFGYGGFGNDIEGLFTISASAPQELQQVTFFIDDEVMAVVAAPPFKFQFNTNSYPLGNHTFRAVGVLPDGRELSSSETVAEFVSPETGRNFAIKIVLPILALVFGAMALSALVPALLSKFRGSSAPAGSIQYGISGGAVCPRCGLPFARHVMAFNLGAWKLERCPHCGRIGLVGRASQQQIDEATRRLEQKSVPISGNPEVEMDKTRRAIDDSKYTDL